MDLHDRNMLRFLEDLRRFCCEYKNVYFEDMEQAHLIDLFVLVIDNFDTIMKMEADVVKSVKP